MGRCVELWGAMGRYVGHRGSQWGSMGWFVGLHGAVCGAQCGAVGRYGLNGVQWSQRGE